MHYREYEPSSVLRPYVRCYWRLQGAVSAAGAAPERVVPDGCPEIILNRADRFRRFDGTGPARPQAEILLVGQIRRAIRIIPGSVVDLFGIRFEPSGLWTLLGIPMHELTDIDSCLSQVSRRLHRVLDGIAAPTASTTHRESVESALFEALDSRPAPLSRTADLQRAVRLIRQGLPSVAALSAALSIHRRELERTFRREVGISPKLFQRICRIQSVLQRLQRDPKQSWAALAVGQGYADQSHLIRDFRLIVGTTPRQFLREQTALTTLFATGPMSHSSNTCGP